MKNYRQAFKAQRRQAKLRNIEFNLTWEQWIWWWQNTGHLQDRGRGKGKYVMSRLNDIGPYEIGNIKCITFGANSSEGNLGRPSPNKGKLMPNISVALKGKKRPKMSATMKGRKRPDISAIQKGRKRGPYKKKLTPQRSN